MIFSSLFCKPQRSEGPEFFGLTDSHSHILPGVDDGIRTIEDSLAVLAEYEKMGFSDVWLTPHIMEDVPNSTSDLLHRFNLLKTAYKGNIILHLGAENMIDNLFLERLESDDFLPVHDNMLLVETSYFTPPLNFHDTIRQIMSKGYIPLLAHPERYMYMDNKEYGRLHEMGVRMQLNVLSLIGFYGKAARIKADHLAKEGMYSFFGSDLHRLSQCDHLHKSAQLLHGKHYRDIILRNN